MNLVVEVKRECSWTSYLERGACLGYILHTSKRSGRRILEQWPYYHQVSSFADILIVQTARTTRTRIIYRVSECRITHPYRPIPPVTYKRPFPSSLPTTSGGNSEPIPTAAPRISLPAKIPSPFLKHNLNSIQSSSKAHFKVFCTAADGDLHTAGATPSKASVELSTVYVEVGLARAGDLFVGIFDIGLHVVP